ncbi:MAG: hypothetical protein R2848_15930 [Thermomicrobiales bacterium]
MGPPTPDLYRQSHVGGGGGKRSDELIELGHFHHVHFAIGSRGIGAMQPSGGVSLDELSDDAGVDRPIGLPGVGIATQTPWSVSLMLQFLDLEPGLQEDRLPDSRAGVCRIDHTKRIPCVLPGCQRIAVVFDGIEQVSHDRRSRRPVAGQANDIARAGFDAERIAHRCRTNPLNGAGRIDAHG